MFTLFLGVMANYGSDDENSSNSSNSSSDENSDVEIENRMKKKKKSFERLEADILENCENLAKDHENREEKWKSGIPTQGKVLKIFLSSNSGLGPDSGLDPLPVQTRSGSKPEADIFENCENLAKDHENREEK